MKWEKKSELKSLKRDKPLGMKENIVQKKKLSLSVKRKEKTPKETKRMNRKSGKKEIMKDLKERK